MKITIQSFKQNPEPQYSSSKQPSIIHSDTSIEQINPTRSNKYQNPTELRFRSRKTYPFLCSEKPKNSFKSRARILELYQMITLKSPTRFHSAEPRRQKPHQGSRILTKVNLVYSQSSNQTPPTNQLSSGFEHSNKESKRQGKERGIGKKSRLDEWD